MLVSSFCLGQSIEKVDATGRTVALLSGVLWFLHSCFTPSGRLLVGLLRFIGAEDATRHRAEVRVEAVAHAATHRSVRVPRHDNAPPLVFGPQGCRDGAPSRAQMRGALIAIA